MPFIYTIYGITLSTPFPCAVLPPAAPEILPELVVVEGAVPLHLEAPQAQDENWEAAPGRSLLRGGLRVGRFLVEDGQRVTLQRSQSARDDLLALAFLSSVIAAVLRQRGKLLLHANTALTPVGALAISGISGAGKSTTLTALLQRGCSMLADDTTVLQYNDQGQVEVLPGVPQMNLLDDAAEGLNYDIRSFPRHQWQSRKAIVPMHEKMVPHPVPLSALYLLEKGEVESVQVQPLQGMEKFSAAQSCIFGPMLPAEHSGLFPLFTGLLAQVPVVRLTRPNQHWSVSDITEILLRTDYR